MKRFYTRPLDNKTISGITPKVENPLLGVKGIKFDLTGWLDDFELALAQQYLPPGGASKIPGLPASAVLLISWTNLSRAGSVALF
jgi:hypothetical protein